MDYYFVILKKRKQFTIRCTYIERQIKNWHKDLQKEVDSIHKWRREIAWNRYHPQEERKLIVSPLRWDTRNTHTGVREIAVMRDTEHEGKGQRTFYRRNVPARRSTGGEKKKRRGCLGERTQGIVARIWQRKMKR